jgi:radical SAM protein with 4Fe4S-binding SPASM domain
MVSLNYQFRLLRGLLSSERAFNGPFYVHIDVTHRCNLKCLCCRWHSPLIKSKRDKSVVDDLSPDLFREFCRDLKDMGTREIYFVGTGEPLLHPHLTDLVAIAKQHGFKVILYTNGLLLDKDLSKKLIDLNLDVLRVSLWATTPEKFAQQVDLMTPDKFTRIIDNMTMLSDLKARRGKSLPYLELCHSITHQNLEDLDETLALAIQTSCDKVCFSPIVDFAQKELRPFVPDQEGKAEICRALSGLRKELDKRTIVHNIDTMLLHYQWDGRIFDKYPCYPAWFFSYLRTDGSIFACQRNTYETPPLGNIRESRFKEIWNNEAYRQFRRRVCTSSRLKKNREYYCDYCSHSFNSYRTHRYFRFAMPIQKLLLKATGEKPLCQL